MVLRGLWRFGLLAELTAFPDTLERKLHCVEWMMEMISHIAFHLSDYSGAPRREISRRLEFGRKVLMHAPSTSTARPLFKRARS